MKVTVNEALTAFNELQSLFDRKVKVEDGTEKVIVGVKIPANKSKTGWWIGRLNETLSPISKRFYAKRDEMLKEFGEPVFGVKKKEDGTEEQYRIEGQYSATKDFTDAIESILTQEEEILFTPIGFDLIEGIEFPASFYMNCIKFIEEPK